MRVVWDLDGVLRHLSPSVIGERCPEVGEPGEWFWQDRAGHNLFWHVAQDPTILERCRPTEYFRIPMLFPGFEIWTVQQPAWRPHTEKWIQDTYLKKEGYRAMINVTHFDNPEDKMIALHLRPDTLLVEDYPRFPDYRQIILIDRPYNCGVNAECRVKTPRELRSILQARMGTRGHRDTL